MKVAGLKRGVRHRHEPPERRDPGDGQPADATTTTCSPRASATTDYQALLNDPRQAARQPRDQRPVPARVDLQAGRRHRALAGREDHAARRKIHTAGYLTLGGFRFCDWNHAGFGMCDIYCGFAHSSDTFFYQAAAHARHRPPRPTGPTSTGSAQPTGIDLPAEVAGHRPDATSGSWTRSASRSTRARSTTSGIGQGYDAVTPHPAAQRLLRRWPTAARSTGRTSSREVIGPDGTVDQAVEPEVMGKVDAPANVLAIMREPRATWSSSATRTTSSTCRSSSPARPAPPSSARRTTAGVLPYHSWFVGFVPKDPCKHGDDPNGLKAVQRTDARWPSSSSPTTRGTRGNAATEIAKYFLQLHYDIKKDYRNPSCSERGNFYGMQLDRADEHRQRPRTPRPSRWTAPHGRASSGAPSTSSS